MRNLTIAIALAALLSGMAGADSFNSRLARGQALLNTGDIDEAITIFRDLQVDEPDSEVLQYDLGCAHYAKALKAARENAPGDAVDALAEAAAAFETASMTPDNSLRKNAQYNRCTALGQAAKQTVSGTDREATMTAFESAIGAYEDYLRRYPDHADAQTNLNHLRYELKKYLQQTPPPQENDSQGGEGDNESDQQDQQQNQQQDGQSSQDDQQQQQEQQGQSDESQDGEQQEQEEQQGQDSEDEGEQQQEQQSMTGEEEPEGESQQQEIEQNSQNIEALLDSLQAMDEQQQKEMRQQPSRKGIDNKWW